MNATFLQLASGMPRLLYWFSNLTWDTVLSTLFGGVFVIGARISMHDVLAGDYTALFYSVFVYLLCATLLTYSLSLGFERYASAQISIALGLWSYNFALVTGWIATAATQGPAENSVRIVTQVFCWLHPLFGVTYLIMLLIDMFGVASIAQFRCGTTDVAAHCVSGEWIAILWWQTLVVGGFLVFHQLPYGAWARSLRACCCGRYSSEVPPRHPDDSPDDPDVEEEATRAARLVDDKTQLPRPLLF